MPRVVDAESRRAAVVDAAARLLTTVGIEGATVRAVAGEAGLSVGAMRHYVRSQDDLLRQVMERVIEDSTARIAALPPLEDPLEASVALLSEVLPLDEERLFEARVWFAFSARARHDPELSEVWLRMHRSLRGLAASVVEGLERTGRLRPGLDHTLEVDRLHALIDGLALHLDLGGEEVTGERAIAACRRHLEELTDG